MMKQTKKEGAQKSTAEKRKRKGKASTKAREKNKADKSKVLKPMVLTEGHLDQIRDND